VLPVLVVLFVLSALVHAPLFLLVLVAALVFSGTRRFRRPGQHRHQPGSWQH
jgi:hypothetical protein